MENDVSAISGRNPEFNLRSGTYRGEIESSQGAKLTIEVRLDIEGKYISADFFQTNSLSKSHYRASMRAKLQIENNQPIAVEPRFVFGDDNRSFVAGALDITALSFETAIVKCTFPESSSTIYNGVLNYTSECFRELEIQLEKISSAPDPRDCGFNTDEAEDDQGPKRGSFDVSLDSLFKRSGIKANITPGIMNISEELAAKGGVQDRWDERELHELMNQSYKYAHSGPTWALQLLILSKYDGGPKYRFDYSTGQQPCKLIEENGQTANHGDAIVGLMFDDRNGTITDPWTSFLKAHEAFLTENDKNKIAQYSRQGGYINQHQRRGAAVFWHQLEASMGQMLGKKKVPSWYQNRAYLMTIMHELGHALNLRHPTELGRKESVSFMRSFASIIGQSQSNLEANRGIADFWKKFDYSFDPEELVHLKHGFYNEVIPGGSNFREWIWPSIFYDSPVYENVRENLSLKIRPYKSIFRLGEPILLEINVTNRSSTDMLNIGKLGPSYGNVRFFITKPDGSTKQFKPIVNKVEFKPGQLEAGAQKSHITNLTYGADGFFFDAPGKYEVLAIAEDQTQNTYTLSLPVGIRVGFPTKEEEKVADKLFEREVGLFLSMGGGNHLETGKRTLETILEDYPTHPLSTHAQLALSLNAIKGQKRLNPELGTIALTKPAALEEADRFAKKIADSIDLPQSIKARYNATLQHFKAS